MRELDGHKVNPANDRIKIEVTDEPGSGGANHNYRLSASNGDLGWSTHLHFQNGPIAEAGVNGITHEALIAVLIDRLEAFQNGPFKSPYNQRALVGLQEAQRQLHNRTSDRMQRGVEGTHTV